MKLTACMHQFFDQYLPRIKGCSDNTLKGYRDTFAIFLPFAKGYLSEPINKLTVEQLSPDLILAFLDYLEKKRGNTARTRNLRLAAIKSLAKMIRFMCPEEFKTAERLLNIPQKRAQRKLIGFLYHEEIMSVLAGVDLKKNDGFRDYTILHLLFDSGARASEIGTLNLDYFDEKQKTLAILGKGDHFRLINLWPKTTELISRYIQKHRPTPQPLFKHRLFINQRDKELTRHGIYRICRKYLKKALPEKRLKDINPAHSFRHSCAVNMLSSGHPVSDIKNHLGHESIKSTMIYLHLDLTRRRAVQKKFIEYTQSLLAQDPKIDELIGWENEEETLNWLDSL